MDAMKSKLVPSLVAHLRRALARTLNRFAGTAQPNSRFQGTSRFGHAATTGALCPDDKGDTVRKLRFSATVGSFFSALLIAGVAAMTTSLPAAEQDNWYLADEWSAPNSDGVAYEVNATIGKARIYVTNRNSSGSVYVYETNGTLIHEISGLYNPRAVAVDGNGTIYVAETSRISAYDQAGNNLWRLGKNANSGNGSSGSGDGEFHDAYDIAVSPNGELFVVESSNHRVQVLDRNGTYKRKFGSNGTAPGQFYRPRSIDVLPDTTVLVATEWHVHFMKADGAFIKRIEDVGRWKIFASRNGQLLSPRTGYPYEYRLLNFDGDILQNLNDGSWRNGVNQYAFTESGDLIRTGSGKVQILKRAYRTKGLANRNVIPQPAIRGISQRAGTNVIDLDFEIVDPDDANATVGILAAVDGAFDDISKWILPTAWVDGTGSKIGVPLATNQVHRVSWNVKGDWAEQTGTLKFEVLCRDARRVNSPVDLHFLELPLADGNMTISRSPIKDSDFETHYKFMLATGSSQVVLSNGKLTDENGIELITDAWEGTPHGRARFIDSVGHRWAKTSEIAAARDASTPGIANQWSAYRPVLPRNLPNMVNEYGFDTGNHGIRAWWVVKEGSLDVEEYNSTAFTLNVQNMEFGSKVALSGNHLAVGNIYHDKKLFFYEVSDSNGSLTRKQDIVPDTTANSAANNFGGDGLAMDQGRLAVGARDAMVSDQSNAGAVYLFEVNGTSPTQLARITASDATAGDNFGISVDLSGNLLAIGAKAADAGNLSNTGAAYLFRLEANGSVTELGKMTHNNGQQNDQFGTTIAISSNFVAVGTPQDSVLWEGNNKSNAGTVTIFKIEANGTPVYASTLTAPTPNYSNLYFGKSIAMSGDYLLVGEYKRTITHSEDGAAYLYKITSAGSAQLLTEIHSPHARNDGFFGESVAMDGNKFVIGATREDSLAGERTGAAYVYKLNTNGTVKLLDRFTHPEGGNYYDFFGASLDISGNKVLVGAREFDQLPNLSNIGSAVLFQSNE